MILEERIYTFAPETLPRHLELYEKAGLPHHVRNLGTLFGYFVSEIGELNECTHYWAYKDQADRTRRRTALWKDEGWLAYAKDAPKPVRMRNRILRPCAFSAVRDLPIAPSPADATPGIFEIRDYTYPFDVFPAYLEHYGKTGMPVYARGTGRLIGSFTTDVGEMPVFTQIVGFRDMEDRDQRRDALYADPDWQAYIKTSHKPVKMVNRIVAPTRFSPLK
jgi:hypothetical protein